VTLPAGDAIAVKIGPIGLSLHWSGSHVSAWPHAFYRDFVTEAPCDVRLAVHCGRLPTCGTDGLLFEAAENRWNLHRANGHYVLEMFDTRTGRKSRVVTLDRDFSDGEAHVTPQRWSPPTWSVPLLLRHVGELIVVNRLSRGRGFLVHAAGISDAGEGLLFVGASGSGKTTLAKLFHGHPRVTVLSDERTIVSRIRGQFFVSGTPWPGVGTFVSAQTVPLRRIYFIEHASTNALYADTRASLAARLLQQVFLPFWDRDALAASLSLADELLQRVPADRLGFVNDERVIEFLRCHDR